jgi:hypothetical protein
MTKIFKILTIILLAAASQNVLQAQGVKNLVLDVSNTAGNKPLELNGAYYTNKLGEKFNISACNYFISNIRFKAINGEEYAVPQDSSYFLLKEADPSTRKIGLSVPKGKFTSVTFTIGVDSLRSTTDLKHRRDALDISGGMTDGMYWTWNSGYIFFKLEGTCEQAAVDMTGQRKFRYHIGGFGGYSKPSLNNIKTVTLDLSQKGAIDTQSNTLVTVNIKADILKVFDGINQISIAHDSSVMFGNMSKTVSENYRTMFSHDSTINKK